MARLEEEEVRCSQDSASGRSEKEAAGGAAEEESGDGLPVNVFEAGDAHWADGAGFAEDLLESIQDGICVLDKELRVVRMNGWMKKMYAHNAPFESKKCYKVFQNRDEPCPGCPTLKAMKTGKTESGTVPYPSEEEPEGWIDLSAYPVKTNEGVTVGVVEYVKDVTEQMKVRLMLERLNEELDERVKDRTAALEVVNRELKAFAYSVSHDLRGPLRAISGFSRALEEDCGDKLDKKAKHYLMRIREGSNKMARLIDGLLVLSRLAGCDLRLEPVDLSIEARNVCSELNAATPGRRVEWIVHEGLEAFCDRRLARILLQNLLGNAFKFTAGVEKPVVTFGAYEEHGETIYFVEDKGVGFNMKYADKLFIAFGRLHPVSEYPGEGIGLATVERIVHRHGGRIWARSEVGTGACFHFTLGSGRKR